METIKEDSPSRLKHFDEDVIVDVGDEVSHLVMGQIEAVEFGLQISTQSAELLLIRHGHAP